MDLMALQMADQLQTAVGEVLKEKGYNVDVTIAVEVNGGLEFHTDKAVSGLGIDVWKQAIDEALQRIGSSIVDEWVEAPGK